MLHEVACGTSRSARGVAAANQQTGSLAVLAATLPRRSEAERVFSEWSKRPPAAGTINLCGSSVLVTLPRSESEELERLRADVSSRTSDVVSVRETWQLRVDLTCRAADLRAVTAIDDELAVELGAAGQANLVPAWTPRNTSAGAETERDRQARHTYGLWFHHALLAEPSREQLAALDQRMNELPRSSEEAERKALSNELHALEDEVAAQEIAKIRQGTYGPFDPATLDLLAPIRRRWPAPTMPVGQELAERLGVASPDDSVALAAGATAGSYDTNAADVSVFGLTFRRPDVGLPAFIDWLCTERCTDIRYRVKVFE